MSVNTATSSCALCSRRADIMTRHHLVPRSRLQRRSREDRKKLKSQETPNITYLCRPCHDQIHTVFTENELDKQYNSLEMVREHPEMVKFINWIKNKPSDFRLAVRR